MTDTTTQEAPKAEKKAATPRPPAIIIRGRMPVAVVALVRFGDQRNETTADMAKMFGTTIGKIDDIKKNRNFAYITKDFAPTEQHKGEGIAWLQKHPEFKTGQVDHLINELQKWPLATAEQAAAFAAKRQRAKGQPSTDAEGKTIPAGGGNRRSSKKEEKASAEGLLS